MTATDPRPKLIAELCARGAKAERERDDALEEAKWHQRSHHESRSEVLRLRKAIEDAREHCEMGNIELAAHVLREALKVVSDE